MLGPVAFIRAPHQVQRQGPCPKQKPQSLLQTHSREPEVHKVLVCDRPLEKAKGARALPPDRAAAAAGGALPTEGWACHGHLEGEGAGELRCSPGQEETGKGAFSMES